MRFQLAKLQFHLNLYANFLRDRRELFNEIPKAPLSETQHLSKGLRIFFWTPEATVGARVAVHDMLPKLKQIERELGLNWEIQAGAVLPSQRMDWLVCFKAVPGDGEICGTPRKVMLICDQADRFWKRLGGFDAVVATSSRPFASLLATRHSHVAYISDSEPVEHLAFGKQNNLVNPVDRGNVLLWHGGGYSQDALYRLRPALAACAKQFEAHLHVLTGPVEPRTERWGALPVSYFQWSKQQVFRSAQEARLAIIPARSSLKNSWLKSASRVRYLYALGVPAIGDARVPDVVEFMAGFDGPLANRPGEWIQRLTALWEDRAALFRLAEQGHAAVRREYSTEQTAWQWIRYLSQTTTASGSQTETKRR